MNVDVPSHDPYWADVPARSSPYVLYEFNSGDYADLWGNTGVDPARIDFTVPVKNVSFWLSTNEGGTRDILTAYSGDTVLVSLSMVPAPSPPDWSPWVLYSFPYEHITRITLGTEGYPDTSASNRWVMDDLSFTHMP